MALLAKRVAELLQSSEEMEVSAQKRLKVTWDEVERELMMAGLCQPALALMQSQASNEQACYKWNLKRGREEQDLSATAELMDKTGSEKKRRLCSQLEPTQTIEEEPFLKRVSDAIVPICNKQLKACSVLHYQSSIPKSVLEPRKLPVKPFGLTFWLDHGLLVADFPTDSRPVLASSGKPAAKIAIDGKGTAYFLSEDCRFLAVMPAVRYFEDVMCNDTFEVKIQLLSVEEATGGHVTSDCSSAEDAAVEVFSPSTDCPEEFDELEGDMDTD
mmetsp:Transcript_132089/g.240325  ORF Transcript_132089/g.240325 Transcript_132089/m.240325 type:complete len:272 (+) Transcript_132089:73-888(+)